MNLPAALAKLEALLGGAERHVAEVSDLRFKLSQADATISALKAERDSAVADLAASKTEVDSAKAAAAASASALSAAEANVASLKADAQNVDAMAEAKTNAILAAQGANPVNDRGSSSDSDALPLDSAGKPISGMQKAMFLNARRHAAKAK